MTSGTLGIKKLAVVFALVATTLIQGCAGVGAVIGAGVGSQVLKGPAGLLIGGGVGAIAGQAAEDALAKPCVEETVKKTTTKIQGGVAGTEDGTITKTEKCGSPAPAGGRMFNRGLRF